MDWHTPVNIPPSLRYEDGLYVFEQSPQYATSASSPVHYEHCIGHGSRCGCPQASPH
jgi:hypothetical protein